MKKIVVNLLLWVLFTLMQCGPVVATLEYGGSGGPTDTLWLMVPFSLLCLALVGVTTVYAVPRLLMRQKWGLYATAEFFMAYAVSLVEQLLVVYIWTRWGIMPPEHAINWGWLAVNTLCNSLMLFFTLLAVGGWYLFDSDRRDVAKEKTLAERIEAYIEAVRSRLRPAALSERLGHIAGMVENEPEEAEREIRELSARLRTDLYDLPSPPTVEEEEGAESHGNHKLNHWLTSPHHRPARTIIFQLSLIGICFGAFFATPDGPEFGARFGGFLVLLVMFEIIAAVDVLVLFRSFRRKRRLGRFFRASGALAALIILPILAERVALYIAHPYNESLFILITLLATAASILMIAFYIAGIGAVLLYQDWVRHTRRLVFLRATTKRLEYASLKKQINPHFLFNVLNNAGILTMLDAADAREMLLELRRLIDYQFSETEHPTASLSDTISFIRAYLSLEATRRNAFRFSVECEGRPEGVDVPGLLFIPFVENAVKYAARYGEEESVRVRFIVGDQKLRFECENPVEDSLPAPVAPGSGGLGVANTMRRLELLYDGDFSYRTERHEGRYRVMLEIPAAAPGGGAG
ncbi:MAG: histidine kinase [Muribaculaceae bacterium]|nr:histidine kinase [Muribaculaceae bacterium]